ncbi:MAG TPA: tRNA (pseudouridine(54)-N(1))-methyltransferase TrmY [Candidatus Thermoplasmatota archaeon]|nr:tRNA (pseudouridine(54)-N(1))-methyltransferase TrmY [Candidatus Thermoplasmatota archaeon]
MRRFLVLGHTAASAPGFSHKDLSGTGGRIDILARCLPAAFLVSHGLRPEVELTCLHLGPPAAPKAVRVRSAELRHLNPDERTSALLLEKALGAATTGPVWQAATPGVQVAKLGLAELLDGPVVVLAEDGVDIASARLPEDALFVLGDHLGFTAEEEALLASKAVARVSLGPVSLQADQCLVVLHNHVDRAGG